MNIGYIKLDKLNKIEKMYKNLFRIIRKDKDCYYIPSNQKNILKKLNEKLKKDDIQYIVKEDNIDIKYKEPNGKYIIKYMLPEVAKYCFSVLEKDEKLEEIHICVENFTKENINIIEDMCNSVKLVNVITNNIRQYRELEKRLERNNIYITVSNNKRKSLKRANLIINLEFNNFKGYSINRDSIIINVNENFTLGKDFAGICIEGIKTDTNKIMRVFSEMNMDKSKLIEAEVMKLEDYNKIREMIKINKLNINKIYGIRNEININEFKNLEIKSKVKELQ